MTKFHRNFKNYTPKVETNGKMVEAEPEVKVVLIDDGVEALEEEVDEQHEPSEERPEEIEVPEEDDIEYDRNLITVVDGLSFYDTTTSTADGGFRNWWVSPGGHGNQMAYFICKLCPNVQLYVARVNDSGAVYGGPKFTVLSCAEVRMNGNGEI
jgi:hypothetical protein